MSTSYKIMLNYRMPVQWIRKAWYTIRPNDPMHFQIIPKNQLSGRLGRQTDVDNTGLYVGSVGIRGDWRKAVYAYEQEGDLQKVPGIRVKVGDERYRAKYFGVNFRRGMSLAVYEIGEETILNISSWKSREEIKKVHSRLLEIGGFTPYKPPVDVTGFLESGLDLEVSFGDYSHYLKGRPKRRSKRK